MHHAERRLFAHHLGDAFFVASNFGETSFARPIAVGTVVMKYLVSQGFFAKAAISLGALGDYVGCYPKAVQDGIEGGHSCAMGEGVMTVMSVLGPAMINANRIAKRSPSGPILALDSDHQSKVPHGIQFRSYGGLLVLNWVEWQDSLVENFSKSAGLVLPDSATLKRKTKEYICQNNLRAEWVKNALAHFDPSIWEIA